MLKLAFSAAFYVYEVRRDTQHDWDVRLRNEVAEALHGRAVQVDPMPPTLKAPGTKRLTPKYAKLLLTFALNVNLRH